jgi:hypothetical protein
MFKCQKTGRYSQPGEIANKLVTHVRNRTYYRYNHKSGQDEIIVCKEYLAEALAAGFKPQVVVEKD